MVRNGWLGWLNGCLVMVKGWIKVRLNIVVGYF